MGWLREGTCGWVAGSLVRWLLERAGAGDEAGLPGRLCRAVSQGLHVDGATLSLRTHTDARQVLGVYGPDALRLEQLQFEVAEGPCITAAATAVSALCTDMDSRVGPWPLFASRLREQLPQIAFVLALPLIPPRHRIRTVPPVGALDLLSTTPWDAREDLQETAPTVAQHITRILLARTALGFEGERLPWEPADLIDAHWGRAHRAAGVLAVRNRITPGQALSLLRARAFATNRPLPDICTEVLDQ